MRAGSRYARPRLLKFHARVRHTGIGLVEDGMEPDYLGGGTRLAMLLNSPLGPLISLLWISFSR